MKAFAVVLVAFAMSMAVGRAVVLKLEGTPHPMEGDHPSKSAIDAEKTDLGALGLMQERAASDSIDATYKCYSFIGNLTIGTPAQTLRVFFDFTSSDLYVNGTLPTMDSGDSSSDTLPFTGSFNPDNSSSFIDTGKNVSYGTHWMQGRLLSDLVNIDGLRAYLTFGDTPTWFYSSYDGIMGLAPSAKYATSFVNNQSSPSVLQQLMPYLDSPVIAFHYTRDNDSSVARYSSRLRLQIGSLQLDKCQADSWVWVNRSRKSYYSTVGFNATGVRSISASENASCNADRNERFHRQMRGDIYYMTTYISVPYQVHELLVQASGAEYNTTSRRYMVDCKEVGKKGQQHVYLELEGGALMKLSPWDYIVKTSAGCRLITSPSYDGNDVYNDNYVFFLGASFFNNHCFAYDINTGAIGIANTKHAKPYVYV